MTRTEAEQYRRHINAVLTPLADEDALPVTDLFEPWKDGKNYATGDRIRYDGLLYRCVQGHTAQASWTPDLTPALWARVSVEEYPEWIQPTGVQDAYSMGDKVTHNEKRWVSIADNNVWEPGTYGWNEVV